MATPEEEMALSLSQAQGEIGDVFSQEQTRSLENDRLIEEAFAEFAKGRKKGTLEKLEPLFTAIQFISESTSGNRVRRGRARELFRSRRAATAERGTRRDEERRQKFVDRIKQQELLSGRAAQRANLEVSRLTAKTKGIEARAKAGKVTPEKFDSKEHDARILAGINKIIDATGYDSLSDSQKYEHQRITGIEVPSTKGRFAELQEEAQKSSNDRYGKALTEAITNGDKQLEQEIIGRMQLYEENYIKQRTSEPKPEFDPSVRSSRGAEIRGFSPRGLTDEDPSAFQPALGIEDVLQLFEGAGQKSPAEQARQHLQELRRGRRKARPRPGFAR